MTPKSGYIERTLTMALSPLEIIEDNCGTNGTLPIVVFNKKLATSLVGKYYKTDKNELKLITNENKYSLINKKINLRSPITCISKDMKMCRTCFGNRQFPTKYLGITAAQCISERLTQLTMRL